MVVFFDIMVLVKLSDRELGFRLTWGSILIFKGNYSSGEKSLDHLCNVTNYLCSIKQLNFEKVLLSFWRGVFASPPPPIQC